MDKLIQSEICVFEKIGSHDKEETYVFDRELYKTFLSFSDIGEFNDKEIKLEKEAEELIINYFDNMERNFENELMNKMKQINQIDKICNQYQQNTVIAINNKNYDYLLDTLKETNRHIEVIQKMKHDEIMIEKEIELKKIELEMHKLKKFNFILFDSNHYTYIIRAVSGVIADA